MKNEPLKVPTSAELIDELGEIEAQLGPLRVLQRRADTIREVILSWMRTAKPTDSATFYGRRYAVTVSACQVQRKVRNIERLLELLGTKKFVKACSFTLKALEEHVPFPQRAEFIEESQTGPRRVEVTPLTARQRRTA